MVSTQQRIVIETYKLHQITAVTSKRLLEYGFGSFGLDFYV